MNINNIKFKFRIQNNITEVIKNVHYSFVTIKLKLL